MELHKLSQLEIDDIEKSEKAISIIYGLTERQVGDLPVSKFKDLSTKAASFLMAEIPGKPKKTIKVGKNKYRIVYDPTKLRQRQYVEILHFGSNPIENMHLIMASIVQPVTWFGVRKNKAEDHEKLAEDLLQAKVCDLYHACVFFCKLFKSLMEASKAFLTQEMIKTGKISKKAAEQLLTVSINALDGFTQPQKWQSMNVSA